MSDNQDPDSQLMLRVKEGDMTAFEELVEKYRQRIINLLYRTLPDATEVPNSTVGRLNYLEKDVRLDCGFAQYRADQVSQLA